MISNIKCLKQACNKLRVTFEVLDKNQNLVRVGEKPHYFANTATPFNNDALNTVLLDKEFTYYALKDDGIMPKTLGFLDPNIDEKHKAYLKYLSFEEIKDKVVQDLAPPWIIKKNRGVQGTNVFLCQTPDEILAAIKKIFDPKSKHYDYVALAQEKIEIEKEYRVVVFRNQVLLTYLKDVKGADFTGNLSPLHWGGARATLEKNHELLKEFGTFVNPICQKLGVEFAGFDVAIDKNGKIWLIEINSHPSFDIFTRDNGEEALVKMYTTILSAL